MSDQLSDLLANTKLLTIDEYLVQTYLQTPSCWVIDLYF